MRWGRFKPRRGNLTRRHPARPRLRATCPWRVGGRALRRNPRSARGPWPGRPPARCRAAAARCQPKAHEQRQRLVADRLVPLQPLDRARHPVETPRERGLETVGGVGGQMRGERRLDHLRLRHAGARRIVRQPRRDLGLEPERVFAARGHAQSSIPSAGSWETCRARLRAARSCSTRALTASRSASGSSPSSNSRDRFTAGVSGAIASCSGNSARDECRRWPDPRSRPVLRQAWREARQSARAQARRSASGRSNHQPARLAGFALASARAAAIPARRAAGRRNSAPFWHGSGRGPRRAPARRTAATA